MVNKGME